MKQILPLLAVLIVAGCSNSGDNLSANKADSSQAPASTDATPSPSGNPSSSPSASPSASVDIKQIPAELQNDAYHYYGLANQTEIATQLDQTGTSARNGSVQSKLVLVGKDDAMFEMDFTGDLASLLGTNQVKLDKLGVHVTSSSMGKVSGDDLELPAKLSPGASWRGKSTIKPEGGSPIQQDITYKVVGFKSITTPVATYPQALYVEGKGTVTIAGKSSNIAAKAWYVKDRGSVKSQFISDNGKKVLTVQESKPSK